MTLLKKTSKNMFTSTQQNFVKKYLRIHPNVNKKYAIKKYKKAIAATTETTARHLFGTKKRKRDEEEVEEIEYEPGIDSIDSDESSDTSYDDIRPFENLEKLLRERNIDSEHFYKFVQYLSLELRPENYEDIINYYLDAVENGDFTPVKSLSPEQRGLIRQHPKCKLYKWMIEIAPNDSIPEHVNILTDKECRYYYMHEGLISYTVNKMLQIIIRARRGNLWAIHIYPQSVDIIDVRRKHEVDVKISDKKLIALNTKRLSGFLNHLASTKYCTVGVHNHEYIFIKHPTEKQTIIILNPHGVKSDYNNLMNILNRSLDPSMLITYSFAMYIPNFSDQDLEGSCVSHSLSRMFYIAYNMRDKEYTIDNLVYYFNKKKIPCQYAIFTQNLKYLAETELNKPGVYESEERTIMKMDNNYKKKLIENINFIQQFKTKNPYKLLQIEAFEEACEKFTKENGHNLPPFHEKFVEFEKYTDDVIRKITSGNSS